MQWQCGVGRQGIVIIYLFEDWLALIVLPSFGLTKTHPGWCLSGLSTPTTASPLPHRVAPCAPPDDLCRQRVSAYRCDARFRLPVSVIINTVSSSTFGPWFFAYLSTSTRTDSTGRDRQSPSGVIPQYMICLTR
ncbi:hypothetical protein EDD16DRAFT_1554791 [Pisolithus croceorrhizus]|nr:hypothetical protein EDD16DRAFT_1554791 [Pisolithus croceorrhizus]